MPAWWPFSWRPGSRKGPASWDPDYTRTPRARVPPRRNVGFISPVYPESSNPAFQEGEQYPFRSHYHDDAIQSQRSRDIYYDSYGAKVARATPIPDTYRGYFNPGHLNTPNPFQQMPDHMNNTRINWQHQYAGHTPHIRPNQINLYDDEDEDNNLPGFRFHNIELQRRHEPQSVKLMLTRVVTTKGRNLTPAFDRPDDSTAPYALLAGTIPIGSSGPSIEWNICYSPRTATKRKALGVVVNVRLKALVIHPPVRGLQIFPLSRRGPLAVAMSYFGPIQVFDEDGLTIGHVLRGIRDYFNIEIPPEEILHVDEKTRRDLYQSFFSRSQYQLQNEGPRTTDVSRGPRRVDLLYGFHHFAGLQMDDNFKETRRLYLTLANQYP